MKKGKDYKPLKTKIQIIFFVFLISCTIIIATTPIHEAAHWLMSEIDPYIEPIEIHLFDDTSFKNGEHILSSALGCVIVKEKYPGAFKDRPIWADILQEIICITIQIIITIVVVLKTLTHIFVIKKPKPLKTY
jgi:hypothetical protein